MTFFIVLFIVMMQFLWKYIDDLVGKGLAVSVIAEFFFYAAVSMVPMALPLAILLASLMTFGNFGEKFELTAMKASGISLLRAMSPLIALMALVAVGAFFFQNNVLPKAQVKMWTLFFSMKQKSPELEIPEGVFYTQIPGYNLFVKEKNKETGMLYDPMIYDVNHGGDNSTIILADSARLAFTSDMRYLYLYLYKGEQFENLREQKSLDRNVPFRREAFLDKEVLIPFDANFNRLDEDNMRRQYVGKDIAELRHTIDSVSARVDSLGRGFEADLRSSALPLVAPLMATPQAGSSYGYHDGSPDAGRDAGKGKKDFGKRLAETRPLDLDSLIRSMQPSQQATLFDNARMRNSQKAADFDFKSMVIADDKKTIRRHEVELQKKYTLSLACIVFFFIGAPLGAIIRKGGLGTPLVISVLLFLFYYIIDNTGRKLALEGRWEVWEGIWLSTFVLAPLGIYVTYKAMNDSAVFDPDRLRLFFRKITGGRDDRKVNYKEVIINDISLPEAFSRLRALSESCLAFLERYRRPLGYKAYFTQGYDTQAVARIAMTLDDDIDYLTDCRDPLAVNKLMDYPVIRRLWVYRPAARRWLGWLMMVVFPVGIPVYLFGLKEMRTLKGDLRKTVAISHAIEEELDNYSRQL